MSEAAKWIVLVFAAGFIGFFGKSLARAILSVFQKKKGDVPSQSPSPHGEPMPDTRQESGPVGGSTGKDAQKAAKKTLKAQEKTTKKGKE